MKMKTKKIAGHKITLEEGIRYIASRPMGTPRNALTRVAIYPTIGHPNSAERDGMVIRDLSLDDANRLLRLFNNGSISFDGRVW